MQNGLACIMACALSNSITHVSPFVIVRHCGQKLLKRDAVVVVLVHQFQHLLDVCHNPRLEQTLDHWMQVAVGKQRNGSCLTTLKPNAKC